MHRQLPDKPGVYLFRDRKKRVIYVGKAKNLRKRVASYFRGLKNLALDKQLMVQKIQSIDHIVVDTEMEALMLEHNLIKKYKPRYNVILKDDKSYAYIVMTKEKFPKITIERETSLENTHFRKHARIFGPYNSADVAKKTLKILRKIFPFRTCNTLPQKVCLYYHIKLCPGPCKNLVNKTDYQETMRAISHFLRGQHQGIIQRTRQNMLEASARKEYERAAQYRNRLQALQRILAKQKVITPRKINQDVLSLVRQHHQAAINLFTIREGRLLGKKNFLLAHIEGKTDAEIIEGFIKGYYLTALDRPRAVVVPTLLSPAPLPDLKIIVPQKGVKKKLILMGQANAQEYLQTLEAKTERPKTPPSPPLAELASYLKLKIIPRRIEAYDISNILGQAATGAMVVFWQGKPAKDSYRRFRIKTIQGANDVAMLGEVLRRRFQRGKQPKWPLPQLIIVDGGRAQLNIACQVLKTYKLKIPVRALAKKLEEIYFPQQKNPIILPPSAQSLMLLKKIRDEAHRFAISYYRKLHRQKSKASILDQIPGIGPKRKKILLQKFGSLKAIQQANLNTLQSLVGKRVAHKLAKVLNKKEKIKS